jgi:hypothetical protein
VRKFYYDMCFDGPPEIPIRDIPGCVPDIASVLWLSLTPKPERTVDRFLENLWAIQLNLDEELSAIQLEWEKRYWEEEGEEQEFDQEIWDQKASETYVLRCGDGTAFRPGSVYTRSLVQEWIRAFRQPRDDVDVGASAATCQQCACGK